MHHMSTQVNSSGHIDMSPGALLGGPGLLEERRLGGTGRLSLFILQCNPANVTSKLWAFVPFIMKNE